MAKKITLTALAVFVCALFTNFINDEVTGALVFLTFLLLLGASLFRSIERNERL